MIQLNENNGNGNASVVFFVSFHLVWRCFFQQRFVQKCNVGVSLQFSSIFNVLFEQKSFTVYFVCWLCSCSCDFVSFVKIFNMQLQGVLVFFNNVLHRNAISVFLCSFHQFSMFYLRSNLSPCILSVGCAVAPAILFFTEVLCFCM